MIQHTGAHRLTNAWGACWPPPLLLQLARKLGELREAAERGEPLPLTPRHGAAPPPPPPEDAAPGRRPSAAAEQPMRKGLRIPGL